MSTSDSLPELLGRRVRLSADIEDAGQAIMTFWPLESFIAANPLDGLRSVGFETASAVASAAYGQRCALPESEFRDHFASGRISVAELTASIEEHLGEEADAATATKELLTATDELASPDRTASEWLDAAHGTSLTQAIDELTSKWCAAFFDRGEATWPMPNREAGFYAAWRMLAETGNEGATLGVRSRRIREAAAELPSDPADAAIALLDRLGPPPKDRVAYLRRLLCRRPGWPAAIKHRLRSHEQGAPRIDLTQYLSVVLFYETVATSEVERKHASSWQQLVEAPSEAPQALLTAESRLAIWQSAFERRGGDELLAWLTAPPTDHVTEAAVAQVVFCIDPRSEGIRRQLERQGSFETLGFAGFFGMPIRWADVAGGSQVDLCPALIVPRHTVRERFLPGTESAGARQIESQSRQATSVETFHRVKDDMSSKFALAEAAGWLSGPAALLRTLSPSAAAALSRSGRTELQTEPAVDDPRIHDPEHQSLDELPSSAIGLSPGEQAVWAEIALRTMGLTHDFAKIVLLCGHGSSSVNNPHASALDCGACGGNRGGENARVACALLNRHAVRETLAARGIEIPSSTWFVAGEHDTSLDTVTILDRAQVPKIHQPVLSVLDAALERACDARATERAKSLPGAKSGRDAAGSVRRRALDWAEVRPEWGLTGNHALVVGSRSITRDIDLNERVFLHSYDAAEDDAGAQLETILTAPMVVAHWINMQYFYAAAAPDVFSAGTKILHNVVGRMGVLEGSAGDLRIGLPEQAVFARTERWHEPVRLLTAVEAPLERIDRVIKGNRVLRELFGGGWVRLAAREPGSTEWLVRSRDGEWKVWLPAAIESEMSESNKAKVEVA